MSSWEKFVNRFQELVDRILRVTSTVTKNPKRKFTNDTTKLKVAVISTNYNKLVTLVRASADKLTPQHREEIESRWSGLQKSVSSTFQIPRVNLSVSDDIFVTKFLPSIEQIDEEDDIFVVSRETETTQINKVDLDIERMVFDIKTATSLIPQFDGKCENLESFIDSVQLLDEITEQANKAIMLRFLKTRLQGKAHEAFVEGVTLNQLVINLRQRCGSRLNSDTLLPQLKATKQNGTPMVNYTEKMDQLCSKLASAYVSEGLANTTETAFKLAEKFTAEAIVQNVNSPETRFILKFY